MRVFCFSNNEISAFFFFTLSEVEVTVAVLVSYFLVFFVLFSAFKRMLTLYLMMMMMMMNRYPYNSITLAALLVP